LQIFGWVPDYYTNATIPEDMPKYLKKIIAEEEPKGTVLLTAHS
jgi:hypothetical protein